MSSADALKKPQCAYFLWQNANREKIQKMAGSKDFKIVAGKTSELWKVASAAEKAPFEKESLRQKAAYDAYVATDAGKKALEEKKAGKKDEKQAKDDLISQKAAKKEQKCVAKEMRTCKAAVKAVEKDEKLKKPSSSYWMWLGANRASITALVGGKGSEVAKKGGEMWKKLSEKEKAPYEAQATKAKAEHDAYIATPEGAAALKAYKDATTAVAYKEKVVEADVEEPALKKQRTAAAGA